MKLQTQVDRGSFNKTVNYKDKTVFLGSCFSTNMAKKCQDSRLDTVENPFGILYNPNSISKLLELSLGLDVIKIEDISHWQGYYYYDHAHSDIFATSEQELLDLLEKKISEFKALLMQSKNVFITLGTSFVYRKRNTGSLVANCHKQAASLFEKEFIEYKVSLESLEKVLSMLEDKDVYISISPIRHLRDGLLDSQLSKSNLRLLCHELSSRLDHVSYYPSYEVFIDEMRDYRFYADDLIHPSSFAVDYIWEYFKQDFISDASLQVMNSYLKLKKSLEHRPMKENDQNYLKHLNSLRQKMEAFKGIDLSKELSILDEKIKKNR